MVQRTFYMVSSIIMPGAEDRKTLEAAREVAKKEAKKLEKQKKYYAAGAWHKITDPRDMLVTIDKYNTISGNDIVVESWKWTGTKFIRQTINKLLR
jgi:hypothetical protein